MRLQTTKGDPIYNRNTSTYSTMCWLCNQYGSSAYATMYCTYIICMMYCKCTACSTCTTVYLKHSVVVSLGQFTSTRVKVARGRRAEPADNKNVNIMWRYAGLPRGGRKFRDLTFILLC